MKYLACCKALLKEPTGSEQSEHWERVFELLNLVSFHVCLIQRSIAHFPSRVMLVGMNLPPGLFNSGCFEEDFLNCLMWKTLIFHPACKGEQSPYAIHWLQQEELQGTQGVLYSPNNVIIVPRLHLFKSRPRKVGPLKPQMNTSPKTATYTCLWIHKAFLSGLVQMAQHLILCFFRFLDFSTL